MPKKVSGEQIEALYAFTKKHFVEYYDLQTELVDHLANAIEEKWQQDPAIDFDTAQQQEFKKFGIFGFMDVVEQRQIVLQKRYYQLLWGYFKDFLKLPKVILSAVGVLCVYKLTEIHHLFYITLFSLVLVISFVRLIYSYLMYKKKIKTTGKRWMLEDIIFRGGGFGTALIFPCQLFNIVYDEQMSGLQMSLLSIMIVAFMLHQYIMLYVMPQKAKEHLAAAYPEYKLENL